MSDAPDLDPVDLSSLEFWGTPMADRDASFAELRTERPISWHRPPEGMLIRRIEDKIAERAEMIVDELVDHGDGDFVQLVSKRLPMGTIDDLMGLPEEYQDPVAEAADLLVATAARPCRTPS